MNGTGPGTGFSEDLVPSVLFRSEPPGERKRAPELSDAAASSVLSLSLSWCASPRHRQDTHSLREFLTSQTRLPYPPLRERN
jgi:hypothetical protein